MLHPYDGAPGMSGEDIYRNFVEGEGGRGLAHAAAIVRVLGAEFEDEGQAIRRLVTAMEEVWEGEASGAARRGAGPLAVEHGLAAPDSDTAQDLSNRQVGSFVNARNSVMPVPEFPGVPNPWELFFPGGPNTYQRLKEYHAANNHNVDVMNGYGGASTYNTNGMPTSQGALDPDGSGIEVGSPRRSGESGGREEVEFVGHRGTVSEPSIVDSPVRTAGQPSQPEPAEVERSSEAPTQETTPEGFVAPKGPPGSVLSNPGPGPGSSSGGGGIFVPVSSPESGGGPRPGARDGGAPGGRNVGMPQRPIGLPSPVAAAEGASRRAGMSLGTGRAGMAAGVPIAPGIARPARGEGTERERPTWLINPEDPEITFGIDAEVSPPIIGEEQPDGPAETG